MVLIITIKQLEPILSLGKCFYRVAEHEAEEGEQVQASECSFKQFIIAARAVKVKGPAEGALDDPAPRLG